MVTDGADLRANPEGQKAAAPTNQIRAQTRLARVSQAARIRSPLLL